MSPVYANYGFHPQREWMKQHEAKNPGAGIYVHWMKIIHQKAQETLAQTRLAMAKYYDQRAFQQPDIKIGDKVMLNTKNVRSKRPSKKLSPKLYGPFQVLEKRGKSSYKLNIPGCWHIHPVIHVSLLEPYRASNRPGRGQPLCEPREIEGDLEWEVERIV